MSKLKNKIKSINPKILILRLVILVSMLVIAFIPIYLIFESVDANLWAALTSGNQNRIVEAVSKYDNTLGMLLIAILQILQDWSIIIPSAPIHIAAGIVLGTWQGFLVCHIADVASNMLVFLVYSKIKQKMDIILPINDNAGTVKKIREGKSPVYMVVLVCLMPAVPNGFIPYAAVNAKMSLRDYTLAVVIGAAPPKLVLTAIGERIFEGQWLLLVILIIIACIGAYLLMRYQKQTVDFFIRVKNSLKRTKVENQADISEIPENAEAENSPETLLPETENEDDAAIFK